MSEKIVVKVDPDIEDLIPGFLENRRADVAKLQSLLLAEAYADIRIIGHSMKGVGGGYGFDAITEFGTVIENAALAADAATIEACIVRYADYLARVEVAFDV